MKKILICLLLFPVSCSSSFEKETIYAYPKDVIISWDNCLSMPFDLYYVYFYSETCGHCQKFKNEIITFYNQNKITLFFVNAEEKSVVKPGQEYVIGVNKIEKLFITGTPTLYEITNQTVTHYYAGVTSIKIFIENK